MERRIQIPELHAGQARICAEAQRFNVLECGRRFGKSTLGLNLAMLAAIEGGPVGWFAPTYKYMTPIWHEAERMLGPIIERKSAQEFSLRLVTGGLLDFWSLEKPDAGRGRKYKRVVIDEASVVRDLQQCWTSAIRPTLTDYRGDAWFLGTPKGRNYFHQLFAAAEGGAIAWKAWRMGTIDNPHIDPDEIEAARADMPAHVFEQEYLGVPADDGGNPFGLEAIAACVLPDLSTGVPAVWGIDLAKSQDWTVCLALDRDGALCRFERWQAPWQQTILRVQQLVGAGYAVVDATGVGDPVFEALARSHAQWEAFKFTATSKQQLMEGLAVAMQRHEIRITDAGECRTLRDELETFEYEYTKTGTRYCAPPGLHDDTVCALALAVHGWRQRSGVMVQPDVSLTQVSPWRM